MRDGFVGYLTTIDLGSGRPISLWRALGTRHEMWFERFTKAGWVEDPRLRLDLEALSTVRVTEHEANAIAAQLRHS